ncbi:NUDIX hydrolase [Intestinimonas sp. HCP28S3_D6]|uniref:NUDIX hydrolase n=1 Tax=Intestinimonas sp. HCP28S3_D6 TaxID=3438942 RepID=UPI003F8BA371
MKIKFYDQALDSDLKYAVVCAKVGERWLLCRHRERQTWELPGGHREPGENIHETAARELREETGVTECQMEPVAAYGVFQEGEDPSFGALFFADVWETAEIPSGSEMAEWRLMEAIPEKLTYPEIQPALLEQVQRWLDGGNFRSVQEDIFELMM